MIDARISCCAALNSIHALHPFWCNNRFVSMYHLQVIQISISSKGAAKKKRIKKLLNCDKLFQLLEDIFWSLEFLKKIPAGGHSSTR